jgi:iron complex outermembrane receptor protein
MIEYNRIGGKYFLTVKSSLVDQYMRYSLDESPTNHQFYSWNNRIRVSFTGIRNLSIKPGLDFNSDWVISDEYMKHENRKMVGLFSEFNYDLKKLFQFTFVFRQEMIDGKVLPFIPALGIEYKPFRKINLTFSVNGCKNYRYPTLNELYWNQYGNPNLKTETDYSGEGGVVYNLNAFSGKFFIESEVTGYYSKIINFIQWLPQPSSFWTPVNVNEVHARGIEAGLNLKLKIAGILIALNNNYHYCISTSERAISVNDSSVGKQLIYIPVHTFNSTLSLQRNGFFGSYIFTYVSNRFTSPDNLSYMQGYYLSNIILGKNFHLRNFILSLQLQINNLLDLDYQSIVDRPMPGRNYALTLKFNFKK